MAGTCVNHTGEVILVYGPNSGLPPHDRDNVLYRLPSGRQTPLIFDCDGIYVTNDRIADQLVGADIPGPVAIKYINIQTFIITKSGNKYVLPANFGAYKPSDFCCPTPPADLPNPFPRCVCWNIPNIPQGQASTFPEVPGHQPAIDGTWETTDADRRFRFEFTGQTVVWTERGTPSTTPGATFPRTVPLNFTNGKFRVERPNDMAALTFLNFQPQSLRDEILARNPQPSFILFTHQGNELAAEWNGLVVTKNSNGTLNEVIQPGVRPPRQFIFRRIA